MTTGARTRRLPRGHCPLMAELRAHERQAAEELGQRGEREPQQHDRAGERRPQAGAGRVGGEAGAQCREADGGVNRAGGLLFARGAEVGTAPGMIERLNAGRRRTRKAALEKAARAEVTTLGR
jgi:hypothetical protein